MCGCRVKEWVWQTYLALLVHHDSSMLRRYGIMPDSHIAINIAAGGHNTAAVMHKYRIYHSTKFSSALPPKHGFAVELQLHLFPVHSVPFDYNVVARGAIGRAVHG